MQLDSILEFFAKYIETELGIVYAKHNYYQLQARLEEIANLQGVDGVSGIYTLAQSGITGAFKQLLLDTATNNETSFFRDPKIFKAIETVVFPSFLECAPINSKFRIWSAASSTGQEALSLSMLISEWNQKNGNKLSYSIFGTDISDRALQRAKAAEYSQLEIQRGLPAPMMIKYFKKDIKDKWAASSDLTKCTDFQSLNLKENFNFPNEFYLILCRNVLIYQSVPSKIDIIKRMTQKLQPGGFLILGSGESLMGLSNDFDQVSADGVVVYRKKQFKAKAA